MSHVLDRAKRIQNIDDVDQVTVRLLEEFLPVGIRIVHTRDEAVFEPVAEWYDRDGRNGEAVRRHSDWAGIVGDLLWGQSALAGALPDADHPLPSVLVLDEKEDPWRVGWPISAAARRPGADQPRAGVAAHHGFQPLPRGSAAVISGSAGDRRNQRT
jgi:hypothetical protein